MINSQAGRPRDTQRSKLYLAQEVLCTPKASLTPMPILACKEYLDNLCGSAWFQRRWGHRSVRVIAGRSGAWANTKTGTISLGVWGRQPPVLLHEMAHLLTADNLAWHGPEYAGVYLTLVEHALGEEARWKLSDSFRKHKVRWTLSHVPKPDDARLKTVRGDIAARAAVVKARQTAKPSRREMAEAAEIIRRAARNNVFGAPGRKPREHALATARLLGTGGG
jgi:hypothetical protein